jgi:hypothetical protein
LKVTQLAGIWPVGDFRQLPATLPTALLVGFSLLLALGALYWTLRRRQFAIALFAFVALAACAISYLAGATPWIIGKTLAFDSPAVLTAAVVGGALLWQRHWLGVAAISVIAFGVLWSNVLAYHNVVLAPRDRLAELRHIAGLVKGHGPTFVNEYEVYADRHFLRDGAPVEPAEYRPVDLPVLSGALLTKGAYADLDAFSIATLAPYPSIVTRLSPAESRPPSNYVLRWQGRYYQLWQSAETSHVLEHIPFGDSTRFPYCGRASNAGALTVCPVQAVAVPPCSLIRELGRAASREHARLVAYQRPQPIVARADETSWPGSWYYNKAAHSLTPDTPGWAATDLSVRAAGPYQLWLGGSFARGFDVSLDGQPMGRVRNELANVGGGYVHVADVSLNAGAHTVKLTYPKPDLSPGSGDNIDTILTSIILVAKASPPSGLLSVDPARAQTLCGRPLDWIELVGH